MSISFSRAGSVLFAFGLVGCTNLSTIEPNQCGNRVVEPEAGEDCDGEEGCAALPELRACRFTCDEAIGKTCPDGYGCGIDGICRRPTGSFSPLRAESITTTRDLLAGDINDDGCAEVVLTGAHSSTIEAFSSAIGATCVSSTQTLERARPDANATPSPAPLLVDLSPSDDAATLSLVSATRALYGDGLSVHYTNGSPTLSPVLFPMWQRPGSSLRSLRGRLRGADVVVFLEQREGAAKTDVTLVFDPSQKPLTFAEALDGSVATIRAAITANIADDGPEGACDELVLARVGEKRIAPYRLCNPNGGYAFAALPAVTLDAGAAVRDENATVVAADVDGDGNQDLLTNATDTTIHVAFGLGDGRFHSKKPPVQVPDQYTGPMLGGDDPNLSGEDRIFVAGELDASHAGVDFVGIPCPPSGAFQSPTCGVAAGGCEAVVADVDADGDLDIVSTEGQELDIAVRRRVADGSFHVTYLSTSCPPHHVDVGDVDGDGVADIAFFDQTSKGPDQNTTALSIAYGRASEDPSEPVASGRFDEAEGLSVVAFGPAQGGAQLAISRSLGGGKNGSALGVVEVGNERTVVAPFYFSTSVKPGEPIEDASLVAQTAGNFGTGTDEKARAALAVITTTASQGGAAETKLLLVDSDEDAGSLRVLSEGGSSTIPCTDACMLAPLPQADGSPDKLLLLGDKSLTVYRADASGFVEEASATIDQTFRAIVSGANPPQYAPRPLVGLFDGDAHFDVVARATTGALVGFFGRSDGLFDIVELAAAPCEDGSCGGLSAARIEVDGDAELELAVTGPGRLAVYDLVDRELVEKKNLFFTINPPAEDATFTAMEAADVDGDGVTDLVIMPSSNFFAVLRGLPERE